MEDFEKQGGIAFFLVSFTARDEFYYLRLAELLKFWNRAKEGGRKSFRQRGTGSLLLSFGGTGRFSAVSDRIAEGFGYEGLTF